MTVGWRNDSGEYLMARWVYCGKCRKHYWALNDGRLFEKKWMDDPRELKL